MTNAKIGTNAKPTMNAKSQVGWDCHGAETNEKIGKAEKIGTNEKIGKAETIHELGFGVDLKNYHSWRTNN
jgi:hypothetical protein